MKLFFAHAILLVGCSRSEGPPHPEEFAPSTARKVEQRAPSRAELELAASAANARPAASLAAPIASAVIEIRERALSLAAPPLLPRHLAFGKGFVLQVGSSETIVRNSSTGQELARCPLKEPRAATGLPGGSALVLALDGSFRFDPGQTRPHKLSRLSLLPGFVVEPRRDRQDVIWVLQAKRLQSYSLAADADLGLPSERELPDFDGRAVTTLRDGSLLYTAEEGTALVHSRGFGSPQTYRLPGAGPIWRLAAADRIDRAWVVRASGEIQLVGLSPRLDVAKLVQTGLKPFDFASSPTGFALVSVREQPGEPREFALHVFTLAGTQTYSHSLGTVPVTSDPDWAAQASKDREVVIGDHPLRVAVGGSHSLRVFDFASGNELFTR